jgi:sporulation related protein
VQRLLLQVALLAAVLLGLSRLVGRPAKSPDGTSESARTQEPSSGGGGIDAMSGTVPDLTFYRTLGDGRAPGGGNDLRETPGGSPAAQVEGKGTYIVQALATGDAAAARRLRNGLASGGFPATVIEDRSGERPVYRVRAGRYRTRAEAEAAAGLLRQKHHLTPWILQEDP